MIAINPSPYFPTRFGIHPDTALYQQKVWVGSFASERLAGVTVAPLGVELLNCGRKTPPSVPALQSNCRFARSRQCFAVLNIASVPSFIEVRFPASMPTVSSQCRSSFSTCSASMNRTVGWDSIKQCGSHGRGKCLICLSLFSPFFSRDIYADISSSHSQNRFLSSPRRMPIPWLWLSIAHIASSLSSLTARWYSGLAVCATLDHIGVFLSVDPASFILAAHVRSVPRVGQRASVSTPGSCDGGDSR